jgi:hypothetical protein
MAILKRMFFKSDDFGACFSQNIAFEKKMPI